MPKNEVRTDSSNLRGQNDHLDTTVYTETTCLGGPVFCTGYGPAPCRVKLSSKILTASGMFPNSEVELIASEGQIVIQKLGEPKLGLPVYHSKPNPIMQDLMDMTREHEARLKAAREGRPYPAGEDDGEPLSDEQIDQEEL